MNDVLEAAAARVRAELAVEPTALAAIEARGRRLRRRRRASRAGFGLVLVVAAAGAGLAVATVAGDDGAGERITAGPPPTGPTTTSTVPIDPDVVYTIGTVVLPTGPIPDTPQGINAEILAAVGQEDLAGYVPDHPGPIVGIDLQPGREGIAAALVARYGDRISVRVGYLWWPLSPETPPYDCAPLLAGATPDGVTAELELDRSTVDLGELVTGNLTVQNDSDIEVRVGYGAWIDGYVVRPGTATPVALFRGPVPLPASSRTAPPGGSTGPMPVVAGVHSCTPLTGTALRPGEYEVIARYGVMPSGELLLSEPVPLTVRVPPPTG